MQITALYTRKIRARSMARMASAMLFCVLAAAAAGAQPLETAASLDRATYEAVRAHLRNGAFPEAIALLAPLTAQPSAAPAALYLHALVHLQQGTLNEVPPLIARLRTRATPDATGYADKLGPVLQTARDNAAHREAFAAAVRRFDAEGARGILSKMDLSAQQRLIIGLYIDAYRGRLASALAAMASPDAVKLPPQVRADIRRELGTATMQFRDITDQLRWYMESSLATSACQPADARERSVASGLVLGELVRLMELGLELFPFNERLMDLAFHGALLSGSYEELERLGDAILAAKGTLRIPFYSSTSRLWLVLNDHTRHLSLELDSERQANVSGSEQLGRHQLFDHEYRGVRGLEQRASNMVSTGALLPASYALKLDPSGIAPHYAFMTLVHCLYGEETQKQITRNLGRYVQHVLERRGVRASAEFVDPKAVTRERLHLFSQVIGAGTYVAASAAESARRDVAADDGRKPVSETLHETAQEGKLLMTRREGLLKMYESVRRAQRESSQTWAETLGNGALARALDASSARIEELLALADVP